MLARAAALLLKQNQAQLLNAVRVMPVPQSVCCKSICRKLYIDYRFVAQVRPFAAAAAPTKASGSKEIKLVSR